MRRFHVLAVGLLAAACALIAPNATSADVGGGGDVDAYSVSVSPGKAVSGGATNFTISLRNEPGNSEPLSGASITLPRGFHALRASTAQGSSRVRAHVVQLGGLNLAGGQTVRLKVTAHVPLRCGAAEATWSTAAWESDGRFHSGREMLALASQRLRTRLSGGCLRRFAVRLSPGSLTGGAAAQLTLSLTNASSPGIKLGSADFAAPTGFEVTHAAVASGGSGSATVQSGTIHLRGAALSAGHTLKVALRTLPAERCGTASYRWGARASGSGRSLTLRNSSSSLSTTVSTACALRFSTEPHNALINEAISGADYVPTGGPVTVAVVDGFGNVVRSWNAPITVGLASNPGNSTLAGSTTAGATAGVAQFSNLSLNVPQNRYELAAASPGLGTTNSTPFDENDTGVPCLQDVTCQASLSNPASQMSVTATPDDTAPNAGTLSESVDVGSALSCPGYAQEDRHWYEFYMSSTNRGKTLTYILKQPAIPLVGTLEAILSLTQVCFAAPYEFTTASGTPAAAATLPDGSSGFSGLLPLCSVSTGSAAAAASSGPCIASKSSQLDLNNTLGFDIIVTVSLPEGLSGDPWGRL